jgi:hypothetical protein
VLPQEPFASRGKLVTSPSTAPDDEPSAVGNVHEGKLLVPRAGNAIQVALLSKGAERPGPVLLTIHLRHTEELANNAERP